jgi:hypothetical protein
MCNLIKQQFFFFFFLKNKKKFFPSSEHLIFFFFFFFEENLISFKKKIEPRLYIARAKRSKLTKSIIQLGVSSSHTLSEKFLEASFASLCAAIFNSLLI